MYLPYGNSKQGLQLVNTGTKLSERDVCTKLITPALVAAGWDAQTQIREEAGFTKGRRLSSSR